MSTGEEQDREGGPALEKGLPATAAAATGATARDAAVAEAAGAEVLLVDRDEQVREAFRELLAASGVIVTGLADVGRALDLAEDKYFAVAVLDMDTPNAGAALLLIEQLKLRSPRTAVVLLSERPTFEGAVQGFRKGAVDVIKKTAREVPYLKDVVLRLCADEAKQGEPIAVLAELRDLQDELLRRLTDADRRARVVEEETVADHVPPKTVIVELLVVDDDPATHEALQEMLGTSGTSFGLVSCTSGGAALDLSGTNDFRIALVSSALRDLPASAVVGGIEAELPECTVLLITPGDDELGAGRIELCAGSKRISLVDAWRNWEQLIELLRKMGEDARANFLQKEHLRSFRQEHRDLLRRHAAAKRRLTALIEQDKRTT